MKRREVVRLLLVGLVAAVVSFGTGYAAHPDTVAHLLPRTAEEWSAAGTWFAVLLAVIAAAIAYQQAAEARRLRLEQAQPYVVAYLEQLPHNAVIVELVIKNLGVTAARNVRIAVDRPLRRSATFNSPGAVEQVWLPDQGFFLAPGQEWRTIWDFSRERLSHPELMVEDRHTMTLTYDGVDGTDPQETVSILDWAPFKGRLYSDVKTSHHVAKALQDVSRTMKGWTERRRLSVINRSVGDERPRLHGGLPLPGGLTVSPDADELAEEAPETPDITGDAIPPEPAS